MFTQATLIYQVDPVGASSTVLASLINADAVPVPPDILQASGLRIISDTTIAGPPVLRTIVLGFDPVVSATIATVVKENSIAEITRLTPGLGYILPPPVSFTDLGSNVLLKPSAQTFLEVETVTVVSGGGGYSAETFAVVLGQMARPTYIQRPYPGTLNANVHSTGTLPDSVVQDLTISIQGRGYSISGSSPARILFDGPLDPANPNARQAQAIITQLGTHGEILAVQVTDPGEGYIRVPKVTVQEKIPFGIEIVRKPDAIQGKVVGPPNIIKPNAATANLSPIMGQGTAAQVSLTIVAGVITAATVVNPGDLYVGVPQVVVIDPTDLTNQTALLSANMGLSPTIQILSPGRGLDPTATAVLTSYFRSLFPDTGDQRAPFWNLMQPALANSALSPVFSAPPALS